MRARAKIFAPPKHITVPIPPKLIPVFEGKARFRGAYGGRGSGKTRSFALALVVNALRLANQGKSGYIVCAREYMKSLNTSSMEEIKKAIELLKLSAFFETGKNYIRTTDGKISFVFLGLQKNVDSIKSLANIRYCWVDEGDSISEHSWSTLLPTVRGGDSEIWVTWNPGYENTSTDKIFRKNLEAHRNELKELYKAKESNPTKDIIDRILVLENILSNYKIVELNYTDNPGFPEDLELQRIMDQERKSPEDYAHIWEGAYITGIDNAYYAREIAIARVSERITSVPYDPSYSVHCFFDLGGAGQSSDATAIWVAQFVGKSIHLIDYIEGQGQPLSYYINELKSLGYEGARTVLPHDGNTSDRTHNFTYAGLLRDSGFTVEVVPNQGKGAVKKRIEAGRMHFRRCYFDERRTAAGLKALGWYHEKFDTYRNIGLGANHDWSSHCADAFGLMAISYVEPSQSIPPIYTMLTRKKNWEAR